VAHAAVLTSYERVTAPFSGVITARNVDTGALISGGGASSSSASVGGSSSGVSVSGNAASGGGSNGSTGQANSGSLFSIAELDKLRVYINIPQTYAVGIYTGQSAQVTFHEYPNRKFNGKITRTASALDPATRTLVAEVQLANRNDMLRPGMFAQVELKVKHTSASLLAPDNAIITGAAGVRVATVTPQNTIHFQPVSVGRDYGSLIEILSGLKGNETVLTDPDTSLQEGEKVNPVPQKKT
jgi:RND family efflux transporter MFP subunit